MCSFLLDHLHLLSYGDHTISSILLYQSTYFHWDGTQSRDPASDGDYRQTNTVHEPQTSPLRLAQAFFSGNNEVPDEKDNSCVVQLQKHRSDTGFQYCTKARRNNLRGQWPSRCPQIFHIRTSDKGSFSIKNLIYVGKLSPSLYHLTT